ncbi:hypothetical protein N9P57_00630 [Planktomarina temperata]|nr:hypothetical protein [Planktomarina temperata]
MAINTSQLALIAATQLGRLQGELEARALSEALLLLEEFLNKCPQIERLESIVEVRNNLLKVVNSFTKQTDKYQKLANSLKTPIQAANILIQLLKVDPTPIAIGTPPLKDFGGLIASKTAGMQNTSAELLRNTSKVLESLEDDVTAIENLVGGVNPSLNQVRGILESINVNIGNCIDDYAKEDNADKQALARLIQKVQPTAILNAGDSNLPLNETTYRNAQGIDYTLSIVTQTEGESVAPKRYAIAKDSIGVVVLRGTASFSSDTAILLDELKFRLDNQLA